jgi:quinohemoprotein amine dehydrogenase
MSRISYVRKTPEGWETTIRRMVNQHRVALEPAAAREIVRYLSDHHGLAPEELRPGLYEVERRRLMAATEPLEATRTACLNCHSLGRAVTQRRTADEWRLLSNTHFALFPGTFRRGPGPGGGGGGGGVGGGGGGGGSRGAAGDPIELANQELAEHYPLVTSAWAEWSGNVRAPRLAGSWAISGYEPTTGPVFGRMELRAVPGAPHEFETDVVYVQPRRGTTVRRAGRVTIYTGYQWRGRSAVQGRPGDVLREVMFVEPDLSSIHGRWFTGAYEELGMDVRLVPAEQAVVTGAYPQRLRAGMVQELRLYGANLPAPLRTNDIDLGPGVRVLEVTSATGDSATLRVDVAADARVGPRDLAVGRAVAREAAVVFDRVDYIKVEPDRELARVGGASLPMQLARFDAVGYHYGADGKQGTADDIRIGAIPATWAMLEYPRTFEDDDAKFVGAIGPDGVFTPAPDGPNPARSGNRNNVGDVWIQATFASAGEVRGNDPLRARAYLVVSPPNYIDWDPETLSVPAIGRPLLP